MTQTYTFVLTENERRAVELLRELKLNERSGGNGTLRVEVRQGLEVLFEPTPRELPPERPMKVRC